MEFMSSEEKYVVYNCFQVLKRNAERVKKRRKITLQIIALRRVNLRQRAVKGWREVTEKNRKMNQFKLRLMLFYYKYLMSKYFTALKEGKNYLKKWRKILIKVRNDKDAKMAKLALFCLSKAKAVNEIERNEEDRLVKKILFKRVLSRVRRKRDRRELGMRRVLNFKMMKMKKMKQGFFYRLKFMREERIREAGNYIKASFFHLRKRKIFLFGIFKNLKRIKKGIRLRDGEKARMFRSRKLARVKRYCFYALDKNLFLKMLPYKLKLEASIKSRCFLALKQMVIRKKLIMSRYKNFEKWKKIRIFNFLKFYKNQQKFLRMNFLKIQEKLRERLLTKYTRNWLETTNKKQTVEYNGYRLFIKNSVKTKQYFFKQWRLNYKENLFRDKIRPLVGKKVAFTRLTENCREKKHQKFLEEKMEKINRRRQLCLIFEILIRNTTDARRNRFIVNFVRKNKKKKIMQNFILGLKINFRENCKFREILKNSLKLKITLWKNLALASQFRTKQDLTLREKWFDYTNQRNFQENKKGVQLKKKLENKKIKSCFKELVTNIKVERHTKKMAKRKIVTALKKIHFEYFVKKSEEIVKSKTLKTKKKTMKDWVLCTSKRIVKSSNQQKSLMFWYKSKLRRAFKSLKINRIVEKKKFSLQKKSMNSYFNRKKKLFLKEIVSKVLEVKERRYNMKKVREIERVKEMFRSEDTQREKNNSGYMTEIGNFDHHSVVGTTGDGRKDQKLRKLIQAENELKSKYSNYRSKRKRQPVNYESKVEPTNPRMQKRDIDKKAYAKELQKSLETYRKLKKMLPVLNENDSKVAQARIKKLKKRVKEIYSYLK